jgi:hypothetical protein
MSVEVDWTNAIAGAVLGVVASGIAGAAVRAYTTLLDFIPKRLTTVSIGSSFEQFFARGPGDNYSAVLWIAIRNLGGSPLYVARAVYFPDRSGLIPVYAEARHSQKYTRGYELKFGAQWQELGVLILPNAEGTTYLPLRRRPSGDTIPTGRRGTLLLEYVFDGKPGIHRGNL